eukprot:jgi/Astpho2/5068/Aster-x0233
MAPPASGSTLVAAPAPIKFEKEYQPHSDYEQKLKQYVDQISSFTLPTKNVPVEHSGPQGKVKPLTIIDDPSDWKAADWQGREDEYTYTFSQADTEELLAAVEAVKAKGVATEDDVLALTKEDFPLPTLGKKLVGLGKEVNQGRGFQLVRGFPVEQFRGDRLGQVLAFWSFALHLGRPLVSQTDYKEDGTVYGSVLNHVTKGRWANVFKVEKNVDNTLVKPRDPHRLLDTHRLHFHSDQGATDLIALLSLSAAKEGGDSKWVSSLAIHNELLRRGRKDLVEVLSTPGIWKTPLKNDQASYQRNADGSLKGYEAVVPFEYHDGYLTIHFESHKYQDIELSPLQHEAVWAVATLAEDPEFHLSKKLQPGDIEIIHNPTIFHARSEVVDGEDDTDKRQLLRWWVHADFNKRPIAPHFAPRSNVTPTGGFIVPADEKIRLPFFPYSRRDREGLSPVSPVK